MKKTIERITSTAILSVAFMLCASSAWAVAPTATAVWEGNFDVPQNGYSITLPSGMTYSKSTTGNIVIGSTAKTGAIIELNEAVDWKVSVLIKYSHLYAVAGKKVSLATVKDSVGNVIGIRSTANNALTTTGFHNTSDTGYEFVSGQRAQTGSGYLLFSYNPNDGTFAYTGRTINSLSGGKNSTLRWGGKFIDKLSIGGPVESGKTEAWAGVVIEKVALFVGEAYTNENIADYAFPSQTRWHDTDTYAYRGASSGSYFHLSNLEPVDCFDTLEGDTITLDATTDSYYWKKFASNQGATYYKAPGCALFYDKTECTAQADCTFGPLSFGGLYVTSEQTTGVNPVYYSIIGSGERNTELGDPDGMTETYFVFDKSFTIRRSGNKTVDTKLYGVMNVSIASGMTFDLNSQPYDVSHSSIKSVLTTAGTTVPVLKMSGGGKFKVYELDASIGTLDFSGVTVAPFIQGDLKVSATTCLVLPAGTLENAAYVLCSGTLTAPTKTVQTTVQVGDGEAFTGYVTYDTTTKSVSYSTSAPSYTGTVDGTTIAWSVEGLTADDIAGANITLRGSGEVTLPDEPISINAGSGVTVDVTGYTSASLAGSGTFKYTSVYPTSVPSGFTYLYVGSNDPASPTAYASAITVIGKLETSGYLNLSAENKIAATGELKVLDGRTKMNTGENEGGICGTLTIESGAVFENARAGDGLNFGGSPTVNVYGTLNMASTRWTLGGATLNFYAGSTVTGTGQVNGTTTYGAFDSNSAKTYNILAKAGQDTVNFSATLRLREQQTFNIADGVIVNCTGTVGDNKNQINITGNGKFKIATGASFPASVPFNVTSPATLELAGGTVADAIKGTGNLSVASGTYEPSFSSFTGPISVSGSGTVLTLASSQITASSGITVGTGSTLKIKVTDEVIATGFDASSKVSNSGGTVMFVNSSGTQITENVSQDGETLNPSAKIWRDGKWAEAVASGDNAKLYISQNSTLTVSEALSLGTVIVVKEGDGNVELTISGAGALTTGGWTIPAGVTVNTPTTMTISGAVSGDGVINVPANTTLAMDGVTCSTKVTVYGTLETSGTTTLSAANTSAAGSLIEVVAGATTLSSAFKGLSGNITIDSGAELSWAESIGSNSIDQYYDHINPDGTTVLDIAGTLHQNYHMTEFGANNKVWLRAGALVDGSIGSTAGTSYYGYGHWTWLDSGLGLHTYGNAELAIYIRTPENVAPEFTVDEDAVLTISQAFIPQTGRQNGAGSIVKAGAGTLCLKDIEWTKPISGSEGTVEVNTAGRTNDRVNHSVSGASFSGTLKVVTPSGKAAYFDSNPENQLKGRPELRLELGSASSQGSFYLGTPAINKYVKVRNLSGWGIVTPWLGQDGTCYYETVQEKDTAFSGTFIYWSSTKLMGLTVKGGESVHSLTLGAASTTTGPLLIQDNGKVVFSDAGAWAGNVTVDANGYLESQSTAAKHAKTLTLQDGATVSFVSGYTLAVDALNLPSGEGEKVTFDINYVPALEGTTLISSSSITANTDVGMIECENAIIKAEEEAIKAYPVATVTTYGSDAVVAYSSVQDAIDNASAQNGQYVTAYQSETVTATGQILLKIDGGAVVTLNSSKAGYAYDGGTPVVDGIYMFSDNVQVAATFKWKTAVASGSWGSTDNWTSDDGTVSRMPGSLDTVIFESAALVETPASGFSFAALQANASVTIKRDQYAIREGLTRTVSAYGAISGTGSLTLNDGVNLANASGASLSIGVPVTVAGATALTVAEGVAASFTGSGTLTLDALTSTSIVGDGWTGTVKLPAITSGAIIFNNYGTTRSTVHLTSMSSGAWIKAGYTTINPKLYLAGNMTLSDMSPTAYTFAEIDGPGALSFATSEGSQPTAINITKVAEGYSGTISSTLETPVTIDTLERGSGVSRAGGTKLLSLLGGTGKFSVGTVKIGETAVSPIEVKADGVYIGYGTTFTVY